MAPQKTLRFRDALRLRYDWPTVQPKGEGQSPSSVARSSNERPP